MEMPVEKKENRTWAIVGTVAAILLCGCPGLTLCLLGVYAATGKMTDFSTGYLPGWAGFAMLCVAIVFIAIAVVVPILLLRKKKPAAPPKEEILPPQEPLPPAS